MAWTDEMVDQLKAMWIEGTTTGEIGKRLGVSKNSIVGKVHRLGLSGRPSPIKKKDEEAEIKVEIEVISQPLVEKPHKEKESKISIAKAEKLEKAQNAAATKQAHKEEVALENNNKSLSHHQGKTMLTDLDNHTCRWPLGDPKDENFHFCGKKVRLGQTYCDEHSSIAYVKTSKK